MINNRIAFVMSSRQLYGLIQPETKLLQLKN